MRRIAAEVGVQAGALYNYTPDKQSLLFDLLSDHMTDVLGALEAADVGDGPAPDRLDRFVRFHIRFHLPRAGRVFLFYMELRSLTPANFARIEALRHRYGDSLEDILRRGVAEGTTRVPDSRVATLALIALLTGISNWYRPDGRLTLAEIEAIHVALVRQTVGAS